MFVLRAWPKVFYQTYESSDSITKESRYKSDHLPRRHTHHGMFQGRSGTDKGYCNIFTSAPRICNKSEEVCPNPNTGNSLSRLNCEHSQYDFVIDTGNVNKGEDQMPRDVERSEHNCS